VASAQRSFSKLKLIKNLTLIKYFTGETYGLALIAIENGCAKQLNIDDLLDNLRTPKLEQL